ncbi:aspartate 1-decarboxylase [Anaerocolumna cellulosilytica]|uniref:Aspartate 1-decarboxylase n=1 Tax=Anaerocolumna cellulosilytica TaxID=433286 RepID=A0A6S6QU59_9FIRM|nr:aspartate 1-decarboxylase [Anaerocolumna cellulosilytica]MBB5194863.1 aspartate 1-decarboxylase [Anaerocolumna cellulosilytica]BCJ94174.1 aspartate 1-decarboxylase [Anaerocolumna cellulosilytica]
MIELLKSKIHRAVVTDANINYEGSITIGERLMESARILPYEKVTVVDIQNGNRFTTYAIKGKEDQSICVNGAAARLVSIGDQIIIMAYCFVNETDYKKSYEPRVLLVDSSNQIIKQEN